MDRKIFLLADDDVDDREMFCEALSAIDSNNSCLAVADGRAALHKLSDLQPLPDLIFLDVNMPVMDGWECLKKLKEAQPYSSIPVIIISTSSRQREMDIAKNLGALCYFTKPHDFNKLMQVLRTIVTNLGPDLSATLQDMEQNGFPDVHVLS